VACSVAGDRITVTRCTFAATKTDTADHVAKKGYEELPFRGRAVYPVKEAGRTGAGIVLTTSMNGPFF
jgi:hypothetical protein